MLDNEELNKDRLKDDEIYAEQNTNLYKVLEKSTDKGYSTLKVNEYEDARYGKIAYAYLK